MYKKYGNIIYISLICVSVITPHLLTLFFLRTVGFGGLFLLFIPADTFCLLAFIVLIICYSYFKKFRFKYIIVPISIIASMVLYYYLWGLSMDGSNYVYYQLREKKFNSFAEEIIQYKIIYQLSDYGKINDSFVVYNYNEPQYHNNAKYYTNFLRDNDIDINVFNSLKDRLRDLKIYEFVMDKDNIYFKVDGMLNNSNGLAYAPDGAEPKMIKGEGSICHWQKVGDNWYYWYCH